MSVTKEESDQQPGYIAILALEALARYKASGFAGDSDRMYKDIATRLVRVADKDSWT